MITAKRLSELLSITDKDAMIQAVGKMSEEDVRTAFITLMLVENKERKERAREQGFIE